MGITAGKVSDADSTSFDFQYTDDQCVDFHLGDSLQCTVHSTASDAVTLASQLV